MNKPSASLNQYQTSQDVPKPNPTTSAKLPKVVLISGPTSAGKTSLVHQLARPKQDLIINADSRQFYQGMDIGTAKPPPSELTHYGYKLIDILKPGEDISAYDFLTRTLDLLKHNNALTSPVGDRRIFIVGGSMFYQEVLRCGLPKSVQIPFEVKTKLQNLYTTEGVHALQELLAKHDPQYYAEVDIHNHRRLLRALEVIFTTNKTFTAFRTKRTPPPLEILSIGVTRPRASLYKMINQRVEDMFKAGWVEEVENLLKRYPAEDLIKAKTIGYEEIITWLKTTNPKNSGQEKINTKNTIEIIETIRQKTRQMAKRQLVWMKKNPPDYLVLQSHENHDKTNIKGEVKFPLNNPDPEDAWMNGYEELIRPNWDTKQKSPTSPSPGCKLIFTGNSKKVSDMLNCLEHILGDFYE